ncbi:MAG: SUMF1/EgtB/PvdO family nonheme iron enzyme [Polyangiaceae bacterium]
MRGLLTAACLLGSAWLLRPPSVAEAASNVQLQLNDSSTPAERAYTGGIVTLRAPTSTMLRIPALKYEMGSTAMDVVEALLLCNREPYGELCDQGMFADELPQHSVSLDSYWLDRTEVTVTDYARCVRVGRCKPVREGGAARFERPNYPRGLVSFDDARDYCHFRGGRLPSEAEWEGAARGKAHRKFPWGNLYNSRAANHGRFAWSETESKDGYAELAPVGSYPSGATPQGVLDLAGNVAEWVNDYYGPYPETPQKNPHGTGAGPRIARGGHYQSAAPWLRTGSRLSADPDIRRPYIGFRCAKSARRVAPQRLGPRDDE